MNETRPHFLHSHSLELVGTMAQRTIETRQRTPSQLLRALRGDVHEEKPAGDGCGARLLRVAGACCGILPKE